MDPNKWLIHFLFIHVRKTQPDGRALYAYKCTEGKYQELHSQIRQSISPALRNRPPKLFEALFCLYAAETWRRNHDGGVWKWETVFGSIDCTTPENQGIIREWVRRGLEYWKRDILHSHGGDKEYLITIACEGGLPLKLLQQESASLNQYFRELLAEHHRQQHSPQFDITALARQIAALRLPKSLHQEIVYRLSGELIQAIVNLQAKVADGADPITALDKTGEPWRKTLPLSLEDDTVKALLRGLIRQAKDLAQVGPQRLRWRRRLIPQAQGCTLESRLELPSSVTGTSLRGWTNRDKHPPRLRLLLQGTEGMETVARLTRTQGEGDSARYRLEVLRHNGIRFTGRAAAIAPTIWLSDGDTETRLSSTGEIELGELPWMFVERGEDKEWTAEGSGRTKESKAWILASSDSSFSVIEGLCEEKGNAPQFHRTLYAIQGKIRFDLATGESCLFQCTADGESEDEWRLEGNTLAIAFNLRPVFLGMPKLGAINSDGKRIVGQSRPLEWRSVDAPNGEWNKEFTACSGTVWLRAFDPATQTLCFRRQADVLPAGARIDVIRIGSHTEPGRIRLSGLRDATFFLPHLPNCRIELEQQEDGTHELLCFAGSGLMIAQFLLELRWPDGRKLALELPFPCQGAAFMRGGQVLGKGQTIALGRLGAVVAVAQTLGNSSGFWLEATVKSDEASNLQRKLWLRGTLKPSGDGRAHLELHRWQEQLGSLLSMTRKLDSSACLEIHSRAGTLVDKLEVARFDVEFTPDKEQGWVILSAGEVSRLEEDWQNRVVVNMIPLWNPAEEARKLQRVSEENISAWQLPAGLRPGPWWILGYDGDWARFRPLLWVVRTEGEDNKDEASLAPTLEQAVCSRNESRTKRMSVLVEALANDPAHPDWGRVFEYFKLAQTYPASALDLLSALTRSHEAMALALIRSSEDQFEAVWTLAHQLPFSWHLLPVRSWWIAAERHFQWLRVALKDVDGNNAMLLELFNGFRQRAVSRQAFFTPLCDWMREGLFPQTGINGSELSLARGLPSILEEKIKAAEQDLQSRHTEGENWTMGPITIEATQKPGFPVTRCYAKFEKPFKAVRCAPFVGAHLCLQGRSSFDRQTGPGAWLATHSGLPNQSSEDLHFELRQLRDFDREWFDEAFAIELCLGLAQLANIGNPR